MQKSFEQVYKTTYNLHSDTGQGSLRDCLVVVLSLFTLLKKRQIFQ